MKKILSLLLVFAYISTAYAWGPTQILVVNKRVKEVVPLSLKISGTSDRDNAIQTQPIFTTAIDDTHNAIRPGTFKTYRLNALPIDPATTLIFSLGPMPVPVISQDPRSTTGNPTSDIEKQICSFRLSANGAAFEAVILPGVMDPSACSISTTEDTVTVTLT